MLLPVNVKLTRQIFYWRTSKAGALGGEPQYKVCILTLHQRPYLATSKFQKRSSADDSLQ